MGSLSEKSDMEHGRKVSLATVRQTGSARLIFYCMNHAAQYGGCFHSGEMTVMLAIALWGADRRLDELPLRCSACGSRNVDVRSDQPSQVSHGRLDGLIQKAWRQRVLQAPARH